MHHEHRRRKVVVLAGTTPVDGFNQVVAVRIGGKEEPTDRLVETAGERDDLGHVDVAAPVAVERLLDRRDAGLVQALAEERLKGLAGLRLRPASLLAGTTEVERHDLVNRQRRYWLCLCSSDHVRQRISFETLKEQSLTSVPKSRAYFRTVLENYRKEVTYA